MKKKLFFVSAVIVAITMGLASCGGSIDVTGGDSSGGGSGSPIAPSTEGTTSAGNTEKPEIGNIDELDKAGIEYIVFDKNGKAMNRSGIEQRIKLTGESIAIIGANESCKTKSVNDYNVLDYQFKDGYKYNGQIYYLKTIGVDDDFNSGNTLSTGMFSDNYVDLSNIAALEHLSRIVNINIYFDKDIVVQREGSMDILGCGLMAKNIYIKNLSYVRLNRTVSSGVLKTDAAYYFIIDSMGGNQTNLTVDLSGMQAKNCADMIEKGSDSFSIHGCKEVIYPTGMDAYYPTTINFNYRGENITANLYLNDGKSLIVHTTGGVSNGNKEVGPDFEPYYVSTDGRLFQEISDMGQSLWINYDDIHFEAMAPYDFKTQSTAATGSSSTVQSINSSNTAANSEYQQITDSTGLTKNLKLVISDADPNDPGKVSIYMDDSGQEWAMIDGKLRALS